MYIMIVFLSKEVSKETVSHIFRAKTIAISWMENVQMIKLLELFTDNIFITLTKVLFETVVWCVWFSLFSVWCELGK